MEFLGSFIVRIDRHRTTLHILQTLLVFAAFICGILLLADRSMPRSRSTTLVLVYVRYNFTTSFVNLFLVLSHES